MGFGLVFWKGLGVFIDFGGLLVLFWLVSCCSLALWLIFEGFFLLFGSGSSWVSLVRGFLTSQLGRRKLQLIQ